MVITMASDPTTSGVATLTLLPTGGWGTLPALLAGTSGVPNIFRNVVVNQVAAGVTPPTSTWTLVTAGGPGTASTYDLNLYINQGAAGAAGSSGTLSGASDLEGGPPGAGTDGYTLYWVQADGKWKISQPKRSLGPFTTTTFTAAASSGIGMVTLASIGISAQPYAWRPIVRAGFYGQGTVNTHVDGAVLLNNATTGDQVGYGLGATGVGPAAVTVQPAFASSLSGSYGQVPASTSATLFLVAKQINSTTDAWSTLTTSAYFTVEVLPT